MKHNLDDLIKLLPEAGIYRNGIYGDECYAAQDGSCRFDIDTYPGRLALAAYAGAVCDKIFDAIDDLSSHKASFNEIEYLAEAVFAITEIKADFYAWAEQEREG